MAHLKRADLAAPYLSDKNSLSATDKDSLPELLLQLFLFIYNIYP